MSKVPYADIVKRMTHIKCADGVDSTPIEVAQSLAEAFSDAGYEPKVEISADGKITLTFDDGENTVIEIKRRASL